MISCRMLLLVIMMFTVSVASAQTKSEVSDILRGQRTESKTESKKEVENPPPAALSKENIPSGSKVYVAPINGYESFLIAAFIKKGTPVIVVNNREKAEYEITGVSESVQAGWAKMIFKGSQQSAEQASIVMTNINSGEVVWGYNVNKGDSFKGKQSSSESCAKHLKNRIEKNL